MKTLLVSLMATFFVISCGYEGPSSSNATTAGAACRTSDQCGSGRVCSANRCVQRPTPPQFGRPPNQH